MPPLMRSQPAGTTIDLNAVTRSSELVPLFAPIFTDESDRRSAATQLHQFILSRRERGETLPNVGAILEATIDSTAVSRPLLTRQDLAAIKPLAAVRTLDTHRQQVILWGAIYIVCVWTVALFWWGRGMHGRLPAALGDASADRPRLRGAGEPAGSAAGHDAVRSTRAADVGRAPRALPLFRRSTTGGSRAPDSATCHCSAHWRCR